LVALRRQTIDPQQQPEELFACLGLENVASRTGEISMPELCLGSVIRSQKLKVFKGDVLYGKMRPYLAKAALLSFDGICSTELLVLEPDTTKVDARFLADILRSRRVTEMASALMVGANQPRISFQDLFAMEIPLPDLGLQNELADQWDAARADVRTAEREIEILHESIFAGCDELW
jgi:restriction endonuclease S subunit